MGSEGVTQQKVSSFSMGQHHSCYLQEQEFPALSSWVSSFLLTTCLVTLRLSDSKKFPFPGLKSSHCFASLSCAQVTIFVSPCLPTAVSTTAAPELPCPGEAISHPCCCSLPCHWQCLCFTTHLSTIKFYLKLSTTGHNSFLRDAHSFTSNGWAFTCLTHC